MITYCLIILFMKRYIVSKSKDGRKILYKLISFYDIPSSFYICTFQGKLIFPTLGAKNFPDYIQDTNTYMCYEKIYSNTK